MKSEQLAQRFANRLNAVLVYARFPVGLQDKARALGNLTGLETDLIKTMLSGTLLPDYDVLLTICKATSKEPGYFLDPEEHQFPTLTRIAYPLGGLNEPLAFSLPFTATKNHARSGARFAYLRARANLGFGVTSEDLVIGQICDGAPLSIEPSNLYVFMTRREVRLAQCVRIDNGSSTAFFESCADLPQPAKILTLPIDECHTVSPKEVKDAKVSTLLWVVALIRDFRKGISPASPRLSNVVPLN